MMKKSAMFYMIFIVPARWNDEEVRFVLYDFHCACSMKWWRSPLCSIWFSLWLLDEMTKKSALFYMIFIVPARWNDEEVRFVLFDFHSACSMKWWRIPLCSIWFSLCLLTETIVRGYISQSTRKYIYGCMFI
jgi:hypothetical protein